jgi:hypothetical protein
MRLLITATTAALTVSLAGCGGGSDPGPDFSDASLGDAPYDTGPVVLDDGADVKITKCERYGRNDESEVGLELQNTSANPRHFHVTVRIYGSDGVRSGSEAYASAGDVAPGEIIRETTGASDDADLPPSGALDCRVGRVQSIPAGDVSPDSIWWETGW